MVTSDDDLVTYYIIPTENGVSQKGPFHPAISKPPLEALSHPVTFHSPLLTALLRQYRELLDLPPDLLEIPFLGNGNSSSLGSPEAEDLVLRWEQAYARIMYGVYFPAQCLMRGGGKEEEQLEGERSDARDETQREREWQGHSMICRAVENYARPWLQYRIAVREFRKMGRLQNDNVYGYIPSPPLPLSQLSSLTRPPAYAPLPPFDPSPSALPTLRNRAR